MPAIAPQGLRRPTGQLPGGDAPVADVGSFEGIGAAFRSREDLQDLMTQAPRAADAYRELLDGLGDMGVDTSATGPLYMDAQDSLGFTRRVFNRDAIIAEVNRRKAKDAAHFTKVPATRAEFETAVANRFGESQRDEQKAAAAGFVPSLIGGAASAMTDPINLATMPVGGGTTVARSMLISGLVSGLSEAALLPDAQRAMDRMGKEFTTGDKVNQVGLAVVGGAAFDGIGKLIGDNWGAIKLAPKAAQEAAWSKIVPFIPEKLRPKMDWDAIDDSLLPDIAEGIIGRDNLSEAEADAITIMRRESEIDARNPFMRDGAGVRVHEENLAAAMQRIFDSAPAQPISRAAVPRISRETLNRGTSISSGVVAGDARSVVKSRIGIVESGGSNSAKNSRGSATGTYQFLTGTWVKLYTSRFGKGGMSDAQIAAKRSDPRLQEILMDDLMDVNEGALRNAGVPQTAGNIYLAHFAGSGGAVKLHRASPDASARSVLGADAVDANPFLAPMSAADVINWAARKMGGSTGSPPSTRSGQSAFDGDPEAAVRADLERQQTQIDADRAAIDDTLRPAQGERDILDDILPEPIHDGGDIPVLTTPILRQAQDIREILPPAVPPRVATIIPDDVADILPQLRAIVRDRAQSLNEPAKLAEALGIDEGKLRRGLTELALSREIRQNKKGQFMRVPVENGPVDLLKFIGRAGGLSEDGLAPGARDIIGGSQGHRLGKGGRDYNKRPIPGSGALVRKGGRSIESIGELLHEAGYFGDPQGPRPSEADVLEAIDLAATQGRKIYPFGQAPETQIKRSAKALFRDEEEEYYIRTLFDEVAESNGYSMDDDHFAAAARILLTEDIDTMDDAVRLMVNREIEDYRAARFYEVEDDVNASIEDQFAEAWARDNGLDPEIVDGQAPIGRNEGEGGTAARNADGNAALGQTSELEPPYLDQGALRAFDDPDGPAAMGVVDSLEHDLRAAVKPVRKFGKLISSEEFGNFDAAQSAMRALSESNTDSTISIVLEMKGDEHFAVQTLDNKLPYDAINPAIAERQAQQAQLKAASPMQANVDQESTIGSPLFDAVDQPTFRLDDEGDPVAPADLLAEIDAEDAMIKNIKDCL